MSKPKDINRWWFTIKQRNPSCMLEDKYDICEAENGKAGSWNPWKDVIRILSWCSLTWSCRWWTVIRYLLLWRQSNGWICCRLSVFHQRLPEDSIRRVYRLGASDYFTRPFDAMTVFHRVESTIVLHDKMTGDLQDAMKMLSSIFHRILKINLSTDTYTVNKKEKNSNPFHSTSKLISWTLLKWNLERAYKY